MKPFQKQILDDIAKALDRKYRAWAILVIGFEDHKWEYGLTEVFASHDEIETEAVRNIKLHLQENKIFPIFVKLKSISSDVNFIKKFESENKILVKCY